MKLQDKATNVLQRASQLLRAQRTSRDPVAEPAWFRVVANHPPTKVLAQKTHNLKEYIEKTAEESVLPEEPNIDTGLYTTRNTPKVPTKSRHLYKPKPITYFEDSIRTLFYEQHPWELARPKLLVERDGNDSAKLDWSKLDQLTKKLDGESVVQRTLYLLKNDPKFSKDEDAWLPAYDQARLEFYRLRIHEDTLTRIAAEEATMFGAVFGKSFIEKGLEKEQEYIAKWKAEAIEETKAKQARMSNPAVDVASTAEPQAQTSS